MRVVGEEETSEAHPEVVVAVAGDEVALTRLLVRHHKMLRAVVERASRFSGALDTDDVTQEAMVDIFKSIASLNTKSSAGLTLPRRQLKVARRRELG
jgi:DNA-directed RNA polymerase specialized sigma24 family protein